MSFTDVEIVIALQYFLLYIRKISSSYRLLCQYISEYVHVCMYACMYVPKRVYGSLHTKVHALALSLLYAAICCVLLQGVNMKCLLSMYAFKTDVHVYHKKETSGVGCVFVYSENVCVYSLKHIPHIMSKMQRRTKASMHVCVPCHVYWNSNVYKMHCLFLLGNPFQLSSI